ncbi:MAG: ATP-binding protein [Fidelibacterota bacterium]
MFVDRIKELRHLNRVFKGGGARLLIVYGRRRVGKTELLRQFLKDKKHLFFSSDLSSEHEQLRQFTERIYQLTNDSFLQEQPFTSWEALLRYVFDNVDDNVPIVIDEFPYLCLSNRALPSVLQKIWDERVSTSEIFLVLCGSYMSFMEKEVLSSKSPLFGRRSGQMVLQPLGFHDIGGFFPSYSIWQRVHVYAILGGTPAYLLRFSDKKTIEKNIKDEILNKHAMLYSEPRFLLLEELREPSTYFSILRAVAFGKTRLNEIVLETGISDRHKVNKYLAVLRELHIIRREVPVTEDKPHKSRKGIYKLEDPFFRFWFRYVFPNVSYLEEGDIDYVWTEKIKVDLGSFIGFIFEDICIQQMKRLNRNGELPFKAKKIGRWWDAKDEIDIVALDDASSYLFCECKWTGRKIGLDVLNQLQHKADRFSGVTRRYFGLWSKSGFTEQLQDVSRKRTDVLLFGFPTVSRGDR